jgi:hypothetical protein
VADRWRLAARLAMAGLGCAPLCPWRRAAGRPGIVATLSRRACRLGSLPGGRAAEFVGRWAVTYVEVELLGKPSKRTTHALLQLWPTDSAHRGIRVMRLGGRHKTLVPTRVTPDEIHGFWNWSVLNQDGRGYFCARRMHVEPAAAVGRTPR